MGHYYATYILVGCMRLLQAKLVAIIGRLRINTLLGQIVPAMSVRMYIILKTRFTCKIAFKGIPYV